MGCLILLIQYSTDPSIFTLWLCYDSYHRSPLIWKQPLNMDYTPSSPNSDSAHSSEYISSDTLRTFICFFLLLYTQFGQSSFFTCFFFHRISGFIYGTMRSRTVCDPEHPFAIIFSLSSPHHHILVFVAFRWQSSFFSYNQAFIPHISSPSRRFWLFPSFSSGSSHRKKIYISLYITHHSLHFRSQ
jgi:hypothetical protein